jgi:hypothetical protein
MPSGHGGTWVTRQRPTPDSRFTPRSGTLGRIEHEHDQQGDFMARIIVTTDLAADYAAPVLLDESVYSIHLETEHNAAQLIERVGWAITDAENVQRREAASNRHDATPIAG